MSISQSASHPQLLHLNPNIQSTLAHGLVFHLMTYLDIIPHWHPELGLSLWTVRMDALQDGGFVYGAEFMESALWWQLRRLTWGFQTRRATPSGETLYLVSTVPPPMAPGMGSEFPVPEPGRPQLRGHQEC